ncbi:3-deoxy-manno-octulosonate cytidylyltransferase [Shewanella avicenniae]|uniref:8-amino-3,8-dideoxy-manno-octulosonate cytidylyltransferase n=1 Tax=Shewanella avicenniae TaxID=2814294 RepID=A0ABX7QME3_9GAMM|nr:3-deoxy-manno-octulosonate cytidylyltransferase [Shewanella avicenniae]QSX32055.1 3-deoxy-manno-octulosonate cytidylyltransferase [Shewanella avicenniae]
MKVILIIPARYGSSRFPGKPLAMIKGKPMIQRVYERAQLAQGIDEIYVATDDDRIAAAVTGFNGNVVMTTSDLASGTDRINQAIAHLGLADEDLVINLQGDQPLADPDSLEQLATLFKQAPNQFEMATLAYQFGENDDPLDPNQVKVVFDNDMFALYFSRSPIPFGRDCSEYPIYKHLGVYAYTCRFLKTFAALPMGRLEQLEKLEQLRALEHGHRIKLAFSKFNSTEVDTPEDVARCERLMD